MSQAKRLTIPLKFGRADHIDPRHAPFGVLAEAVNLRVDKDDGRLVARTGYQPLAMTTKNGTLITKDLHEYQDRLVALGSDNLDAYPTDLFEYLGLSSEQWKGTDAAGRRVMLNPFTNPRLTCGIPQVEGGVTSMDAYAGGGYTALVYQTVGSASAYLIVCRQSDDQVIHQSRLSSGGGARQVKVVFAIDTFYMGILDNNEGISLKQFTPGTSTAPTTYATLAAISPGNTITAWDIAPVGHGSTGRVIGAYDRSTVSVLDIKTFQSNGTQLGATVSVAGTNTVHLQIEADQAQNTINLYAVETVDTGQLRTFNFATGALSVGPTATVVGPTGSLVRLPAQGAFSESVAVLVNLTATPDVTMRVYGVAAHAVALTKTYKRVLLRGKPVSAQSPGQNIAVAFCGLVAPQLPTKTFASNALFCVGASNTSNSDWAHMSTRDYLTGLDSGFVNVSLDASTGRLCWPCLRDPGVSSLGNPTVELVDFKSTKRRQGANYGGLLYLSGCTMQVHDGRFPGELLFNEVPGVISLAQGSGGALTPFATYSYIVAWEYVSSEQSLQRGAPSADVDGVRFGAIASITISNVNRVTVVVSAPHSIRVAAGDDMFGGDVTVALFRTVWDPLSNTQGSTFKRVATKDVPSGISGYGSSITIVDDMSDAVATTQETIYTQGDRGALSGPLEHDAPQGCSFVTADAARLLLGGLAVPYRTQISKGAFLSEPFEFSELSTFFNKVSRPIVGVFAMDTTRLVFTADEIYVLFGDGPDDLGGGALSPPQEIPTPSGLKDWRSFLKLPEGAYFQLDNDKLFIMPRGGGSPAWAGESIQDLLALFPTITGTARHKADNCAVFACNNLAGTDARLAVQDLKSAQWTTDTPVLNGSNGIDALVPFGRTMAYCSGGTVYVQSETSFADNVSTFIATLGKTNPIYPFELGGKGLIQGFIFVAEYLGDCNLNMRVSLDDGLTFDTLPAFAVTAANGYSVGEVVRKFYTLPTACEKGSLVIEFSTSTAGSATRGLAFLELEFEIQPEPGFVNLDPADLC